MNPLTSIAPGPRKLLIVSPHFPPVNAADMHRVRLVLPFLARNGWSAEVLAVDADRVASPLDPWLAEGLPPGVPVHRVKAMGLGWSRVPGLGGLGRRSLVAMATAGDRLLAASRFDLVYFSTTVFEVNSLGPRWKRKFGVPFVLDYQDPWVNDYYRQHPDVVPPGGRIKHGVYDALHRWMEPRALRECAGITCVSPEYPRQLRDRYGWFEDRNVLVQPFPGAVGDFERLPPPSPVSHAGEWAVSGGLVHWVYVGRGGPDMAKAFRAILLAMRDHAPEGLLRRIRLHLVGTSYSPPGTGSPTLEPIARELGLGGLVNEQPDRIPYSETLALLRRADALVMPGSDDPAYTASKIYPYLLARKPLLVVCHENSSMTSLVARVGGATCVPFRKDETVGNVADRIASVWMANDGFRIVAPLDLQAFRPHTDQGCAEELGAFFRRCLL